MSRRQPAEEGLLFDLPLETTPAEPAPAEEIEQPALPLAEEEAPDAAKSPTPASPMVDPPARSRPGRSPTTATLGQRATAGLTDLGVCIAVAVVLLVALLALGVKPGLADWPAGALFLLTFSFLYAVLPLAFWGRTPGMALAGLQTSSTDGRRLTFRQAVLAWLGSVLTVALAGLPLLLALGGRSFSDLISGSETRRPGRPT